MVYALAAFLLLPVIGIGICAAGFVRRMPWYGRLAMATAAGALIVGVVMALMSLAGLDWSRTSLLPPLALITIAGVAAVRRFPPLAPPPAPARTPWEWAAVGGSIACWLVTLYGTVTARETCGDLPLTWGPKAIKFFRAGGIDAGVLHAYPQLTVDYPPLHTLLLAWSNALSHDFSWWAALLSSPLFFAATLALIRAWTGDDLTTLLAAATLTWTYTLAYPAGCAEPVLFLFEALAILALTFGDDARGQTIAVTLGAAGAAWTKLEGSTFVIAVLIVILVAQRSLRRAVVVAIPAAVLMAGWMAFVFANDLLYMYGGARLPIYPAVLPVVLETLVKVARFDLLWLPWIVPLALIVAGNVRRAAAPLLVSLLTTAAAVYFYLHYYDPVWWIESSSPRVILTPLLALLIGAGAAWRKPAV
jgi:hypothetical protein